MVAPAQLIVPSGSTVSIKATPGIRSSCPIDVLLQAGLGHRGCRAVRFDTPFSFFIPDMLHSHHNLMFDFVYGL
jgi:hypothetical protein